MFSDFFQNKIARFLAKATFFYLLWFLIYELWLHPNQTLDLYVISLTVYVSKLILNVLGYEVFTGAERLIGIDGTGGLWIGDNCNGIVLFALFAGFIISFPGKVLNKTIYIILGIILIELVNILRVVALAILQTHSVFLMEFNHTYTFTIVIYGFIFLLWMMWVNKYSGAKTVSAGE